MISTNVKMKNSKKILINTKLNKYNINKYKIKCFL